MTNKIFTALLLLLIIPFTHAETPQKLNLHGRPAAVSLDMQITDIDWRWLGKKQRVTVATWDSENPPLDIALDSGTYEGIFADYLKIILTNLGVRSTILRFPDRQQALEALAKGQVDIMIDDPGVKETLAPAFATTRPLIDNRPALVRLQVNESRPLDGATFTLAVSDSYLSSEEIKALYPQAKIIRYRDNAEALGAVAYHHIDAALGNLTSFSFLIDRNFNNELSIDSLLPLTGSGGRMVLRQEDTSLLASINAAIAAIPPDLAKSISQEWFLASDYGWLSAPDTLTAEEKKWIKDHPVVDVVADPLFAPLTIEDKDNVFRGISSDVLHLISLRTGLQFRLRAVNDLGKMVSEVRENDADMLAAITWSGERAQQLTLTRPYLFPPYVLIVADRQAAPETIRPDMTLAVATGNVIAEDLQQRYPGIRIISVPNASLALKMVEEGKADAAIHNQAGADFIIERYFKGQLRIASQLGLRRAKVSFGVSRQQRELESILNKSLAEIPPRELAKIALKWQGTPVMKIETWRNYTNWHLLALALSGLLIVGVLFWALTLRRAVSRRKKAQQELSDELEFREVLLNGAPEPIYVIDGQGRVKRQNDAWRAFFHSCDPQVLALPLFDSRHPLSPVLPALLPLLNSGEAIGKGVHRQRCFLTIEGQVRTIVHWAASMPKSNGKESASLVCGWQDITEHEQLLESVSAEKSRAEVASKAKGTFLATMSHEIRTPVSAIIGLLELAETTRSASTPEGESVRLAYTTAQSLLELIGDVLDLAKIEAESLELAPAWNDPVHICQQTLAIFDGLARQKGLELQFDNQLNSNREYWFDAQRVRQIIFNFLSNSLKFTFVGKVGIRLSESVADEKNLLLIEVFDSGIGISEEEQPKLFQPYSQLDEGKKQIGTGLGLVISAELTRMMNGTLQLDSELHKGTRITVILPVTWRNAEQTVSPAIQSSFNTALPRTLHVLVVDDHDTNRLILRRQLERLDCRVTEAADGEEALLFLEDDDFDLIITDCQMPVMDGIALTRAVRENDRAIPVWGLTANAQSSERERCLAAGMNECLFKPLLPEDLKNRLIQAFPTSEETKPGLAQLTDFVRLYDIIGNNRQHMQEFLTRAFNSHRQDYAALLQASKEQNIKEMSERIHRLVGSAEVLGAARLRGELRTLETLLKSGSLDTIPDLLQTSLRLTLEDMEAALESYAKEIE
ncbi:transporter substrate-binding domain-containing protein [Enterobacter cloacae]|uniref:response regulator n=1 Tax=Enterobacter cloacae TaxID=550 RepID=UPI001E3040EB|nr:transporter substrate-binding domain-containing protein [Enterobacter cloacae]MCE1972550.1 transporter substrate-binding domain-containing protein [Enterobacter cloacae]